jgi:Zn-dependent metalloprotease
VKFLKQGVCLALIGAGLAAAPVSLAAATAPTSAAAVQAASAPTDLVSQIRDGARGSVTAQTFRATGASGMLRASVNGDLLPSVAGDSKAAAAAKTDAFLSQYGAVFGAGEGELTRSEVTSDGYGGWTSSYTQSYKGVPVFASRIKAHVNADGALTAVSGYASPGIDLSTTPRFSQGASADQAIAMVKTSPALARNGGTAKAKDLKVVANTLMIYRTGVTKGEAGDNHLAWVSEVSDGNAVREQVIVDAQTGKLLNRWSMLDNALDRRLYETNYNPASPATNLQWSEGQPLPGALNADQLDEVVTSGESYWFFRNVFDRDSYDGNGATRITVNNDPTIACPNANWNGVTTNYCTGVSSDDVVAHEWGHAYTEYTSGLIYQWQSGALNESYSDVWGETLDLINNRDDAGEGDLNAKRPDNLCSLYTRGAVQLEVSAPVGICDAAPAAFGPTITAAGFTDDLVVALDPADGAGPTVNDGCSAFTNAGAVNGKFAYVDRGTCSFQIKANNAVAAGATGIVVGTNSAAALISMSGVSTIPGLMVTQAKGTEIKAAAVPLTATMRAIDNTPKADSYRWLVSEKATSFGGAIRDMWNPNCYGDAGKVSDVQYVCDTSDQGGVHSNSGVPNHTYALMVDGGTFNGQTITGLGLTKAAHILWQAQSTYETPVTGFPEHAAALEASCNDLIGAQLDALQVTPNGHGTFPGSITAADCAEVHKVTLATQLRTPATQCNFQPMLNPSTPSACGTGTGVKPGGYLEDFEDGLAGWDLTSPAPVFPGGLNEPWASSTELPAENLPAGDHTAAFGPAPDQAGVCNGAAGDFSSVNYLTSPTITVGAAGDVANSQRLSFTHNVRTEIGFDGGTVMIQKNGAGPFTTVPAAAYVFNPPTTLATTAAGSTNPLQGQPGFTGTDGGTVKSQWGTSIINLSHASLGVALGDTIKIRFAIGRDGCGGVYGWWVDNVKVNTCVTAPTVAATHVPEPSAYGSASSVNVTVSGASGTPTGTVTVKEGATTVGTGTLSGGTASVALPASLSAGAHPLTVSYGGDGTYPAATGNVTANVNKASSTTSATAPKKVKFKKDFDVKATVAAAGGSPTGTVEVYDGTKLIGTGTLSNGTVTIHITKNLKSGKHTLTVKYLGSTNVAASQTTVKVKVKKN